MLSILDRIRFRQLSKIVKQKIYTSLKNSTILSVNKREETLIPSRYINTLKVIYMASLINGKFRTAWKISQQ